MASNSSSEYKVIADKIVSPDEDIVVNVTGAVYKDSITEPNRYATMSDITTPTTEVSFTVAGGSAGTAPTFNGAPLFSGSYIKTGDLVHFQIQVDMDNITNFGTGQYYVDLPFPSKYGYKFREGCLHDISTGKDYEIGGHVLPGESRVTLTSTDTQSGTVFDIPFTSTAPVTLTTADNFHVSGTYITE